MGMESRLSTKFHLIFPILNDQKQKRDKWSLEENSFEALLFFFFVCFFFALVWRTFIRQEKKEIM